MLNNSSLLLLALATSAALPRLRYQAGCIPSKRKMYKPRVQHPRCTTLHFVSRYTNIVKYRAEKVHHANYWYHPRRSYVLALEVYVES
jgi:hypothetical protein